MILISPHLANRRVKGVHSRFTPVQAQFPTLPPIDQACLQATVSRGRKGASPLAPSLLTGQVPVSRRWQGQSCLDTLALRRDTCCPNWILVSKGAGRGPQHPHALGCLSPKERIANGAATNWRTSPDPPAAESSEPQQRHLRLGRCGATRGCPREAPPAWSRRSQQEMSTSVVISSSFPRRSASGELLSATKLFRCSTA